MTTRTHRPIPLALSVLIALFSALAALAVSGGRDAHAHGDSSHFASRHTTAAGDAATISRQELPLRGELRRLWEDHVTWTRLAVISLTTDAPDADATVGRLLENQTHIGDAIKPYYGAAAGRQLTALLRQH